MKKTILLCLCLITLQSSFAQFTQADSLRGMLRHERTCYDVGFYDLNLNVDFKNQTISGYNTIQYKVLRGFNVMQIDLFSNMLIDSIVHQGKSVDYRRKHNAVFVDLGEMQEVDKYDAITVYYHGKPRIAVHAPWDGGFTWTMDKNKKPWLGVSCEGIGASLWWPNKDHLSDEPDSMRIRCTVPKGLTCVANGVMRSETKSPTTTTFEWFVSYPINNYNVTLNVAEYVHFSDTFISPTDGSKLPMDYYVLPYNLAKAQKQFKEAHEVLRIFEKYLDKYPFWNDGYALVETPYLGMEHQGAIAYGNQYMPGYMGRHPTGIPEDYIILHETGHEWWGNSVSCNDHAELWIHETFCTYMESVYVEEKYGYADAVRYLKYHSAFIENNQPIVGPLNVNYDKSDSDMYYKGAMMLHTLRNAIDNDSLWWDIVKTFYRKYTIKNAVTQDFIDHVNEKTGKDFTYFFDQYLKTANVPTLLFKTRKQGKNTILCCKWLADIEKFALPIFVNTKDGWEKITPNAYDFQEFTIKNISGKEVEFKFGLFGQELVEE